MIIIINTATGIIEIKEKEFEQATIPHVETPIQYNPIDIKRKYLKKGDPGYHRTKTISKFSKFGKIVKQEPLLDLCY